MIPQFNFLNTLKIAYWYNYIKIKPTTLKEIEYYNYLINSGLMKFEEKFGLLSLTEQGINYLKENRQI